MKCKVVNFFAAWALQSFRICADAGWAFDGVIALAVRPKEPTRKAVEMATITNVSFDASEKLRQVSTGAPRNAFS